MTDPTDPATHRPLSTYRLQLRPDWGFDQAAEVADYLTDLGITHLYASPYLQAAPGSTHGYDVVDPTRVNEELGGEPGRQRLVDRLEQLGLGQVLDIVPNHVALVTPHNPWWWDVLTHGRDAAHADHFDIDWDALDGKVLVPILGSSAASEIARGNLAVGEHEGEPAIVYHEHVFPIAPGTDLDRPVEEILADQHYELAFWRRASTDLNYRRFFDITTLGGVRVEDPQVWSDSHDLIVNWLRDGSLDGVRIDHPDGLWDPETELERLREAAPDAWIVVEKILEPGEQRRAWPIDGTVGYDFCNQVLGVLVDPAGEEPLSVTYEQLTGESTDWHATVEQAKRQVLSQLFGAEIDRLTRLLARVADDEELLLAGHRLREAVVEAVVAFPVYRTYVRADLGLVEEPDAALIDLTIVAALDHRPDLGPALDLLRRALLLETTSAATAELAMRFQQLTGPAMAKGVEDTSFYRYVRFVALNEVGGDPSRFGLDEARFHAANLARQREWPTTMLLTSTHDTKRSEDVRARLAVLSEIPERWDGAVRRWFERNARHRTPAGPSRNLEYLLYQTVVGAWPIGADRLVPYLEKAAREEKRETDWHDQDERYEQALARFATQVLEDETFRREVAALVDDIRDAGWINSLVQTAVKLTSPGVPDTYQGCELWDLSLVDPDNRRAVDFDLRRKLLADLDGVTVEDLWQRRDEGLPKLALTRAALHLRRTKPHVFGPDGTYTPLSVDGPRAPHVLAYARSDEVAVIVPRLTVGLGERFGNWDWQDTTVALPPGPWTDVVTGTDLPGGQTRIAEALQSLPVAVLERKDV